VQHPAKVARGPIILFANKMSNLSRFKVDLDKLLVLGNDLHLSWVIDNATDKEILEIEKKENGKEAIKRLQGLFRKQYQNWYTAASALVKQLIPDRHTEFVNYYLIDPRRKEIGYGTYKIQDWMNGSVSAFDAYDRTKYFNDTAIVSAAFESQRSILAACKLRFESALLEIRQIIQADFFDSEIEAAKELHKKGFLRGAGAICGVILEKHLAQVAVTHSVTIRKAHPTIADLNDPLKQADVYDVPAWRNVQRLADIRNLCDHNKSREPTKDEVEELIQGTEKITKTIY